MRLRHISRLILSMTLFCIALTATAQKLQNGVNVVNKEVKRTGNTVNVSMDLNLDDLKLNSNKGVIIIPMIVNEDDTVKMPAAEILGFKRYIYYQRNNQQTATANPLIVAKRNNGKEQTLHYTYTTPFQKWMNGSQLVIGQDACGCNQVVAQQNVLDPMGNALLGPMKVMFAYVQPKAEVVKTRQENGSARLQFKVNKSDINAQLGNNVAELDKMRKTIDLVKNDPDVTITSIKLHGYASPDGRYDNNERLASNRTKAVFNYLRSVYPVEEKLFQFSSTAEDWDGAIEYLKYNEVPQKEALLKIANNNALTPDEKEKTMATKLSEGYRYLLNNVFPDLRRTEYTINYDVRNFNLEEARKIIETRPQKLSLQEMYAVANSYEQGSEKYNYVFDVAVTMFPEDELANLNAAYVAINRGDKANAEKYLKKAGNRPEADNARGALAVANEDYTSAKAYFEKASEAGLQEATKNLEELKKRM